MIDKFIKFLDDPEAAEFFITGVAGTGKTTSLKELIDYCQANHYTTVTCAYTHKAVSVLKSKLPKANNKHIMCTLHSYLKKCPTINDTATKLKDVDGNTQVSIPSKVDVIFIDEFSMIGEKDYVDIVDTQYDEDANIITKVVYIGDPNQLPPVKDMQTIFPKEPYWVKLTTIHRQAHDNPLIGTLIQLNDFIDGKPAVALTEHAKFVRNQDIISLYKKCRTSKILLAYTNARVQDLNAKVQGYEIPLLGDTLFSPTTRQLYTLEAIDEQVDNIKTIRGEILELGSRYKTLETIHTLPNVQFFLVADKDMHSAQRAVIFGHNNYLQVSQDLANIAVKINKKIESQFQEDAKLWAHSNWSHPLAKERAQAWKNYLSFKGNVLCMDFTHAMTIHKSQGSTYENVFLDMDDIHKCANSDYQTYLKLLYVAISRAADTVYTN